MVWRKMAVFASLAFVSLGCDGTGSGGKASNSPGGEGSKAGAEGCVAGDQEVGVAWVRAQRERGVELDAAGAATQRETLRAACEDQGCGPACVELARSSASAAEAKTAHQRACDAGEQLGCQLSVAPTATSAAALCEAGEWLGCVAALSVGERAVSQWEALERSAGAACEALELRACTASAWARCAGAGSCDADALELSARAMSPAASDLSALTHAVIACHAGQGESADASLTASCEQGLSASCERRCETLGAGPLVVFEPERARIEHISLLLALSPDVQPAWFPVVSTMDAETLAGFEKMLEAFTPPLTEAGAAAKVPAGVREHYPVLVEAILRAPQVDAKKIKYWFGRLAKMDDEQRGNLLDSLRKQWWIIPGDKNQTPQAYIDRVRLRSGELAPAWTE